MKLVRFGPSGREKPGILDSQGRIRDLSGVVPDIAGYDTFYKRLISTVPLKNVTSRFAMEKIKSTTALPIPQL